MARNALADATSPYLLQHADNPVDWQQWGPAALAQAKAENKPILLSIGYAACHWCHVMAHESFENPAIAERMNRVFVNIKVDREERPDLDAIYQAALAMLGQQGGWPLTMFLAPDGQPFWGGTYFPPAPRWGRPGFPQVLDSVAEIWRSQPDRVENNMRALGEALARHARNQPAGMVTPTILDEVAGHLVGEIDPVWGGIGKAPKFPQVSILKLLLRAGLRTGETRHKDAVLLTLRAICQGGIYDHLGGGFARYSTDDEWLAPHFEKMLYDNAQLIELLGWAWQITREPLFATRVEETVGWVLREMIAANGAFAATLDADSEGEEGRFYVWTAAEIGVVLGPDAAAFCAAYDVAEGGNWEGHSILNRRRTRALGDPATEARLAAMRARLLAVRDRRVRPGWDDKVLADWNGLMIAALAEASQIFDRPAWLAAAQRAFAAVVADLGQPGERLAHSWRGARTGPAGMLEDYADMARAALALHEATGDAACLERAQRWTETLARHFWDPQRGGYFQTADDTEALIVRTKSVQDSAVPCGNGTMVEVLARLHLLTGDAAYGERAERLVEAFSGELARNFFPLATLLNGAETLIAGTQIVIAGDREAEDTRALVRTVYDHCLPERLLTLVAPGQALPAGHPAAGKGRVDGRAAAYLCRRLTCQPPVTAPADLAALLGASRAAAPP